MYTIQHEKRYIFTKAIYSKDEISLKIYFWRNAASFLPLPFFAFESQKIYKTILNVIFENFVISIWYFYSTIISFDSFIQVIQYIARKFSTLLYLHSLDSAVRVVGSCRKYRALLKNYPIIWNQIVICKGIYAKRIQYDTNLSRHILKFGENFAVYLPCVSYVISCTKISILL